jgi:two-component system OmpR family sensor kinase
MSSSPLTRTRWPKTQWRRPGTWPLRTRLVAIMIALLCLLGILVGGIAEGFLSRTLYRGVDARLAQAMSPGHPDGGNGRGGYRVQDPDQPFPGSELYSIVLIHSAGDGSDTYSGGVVRPTTQADTGYAQLYYEKLTPSEQAILVAVPANGRPATVDLGDRGSWRVEAQSNGVGDERVIALSLHDTNTILLRMALVTGGAVLIALGVAGWAGAVIVRRTLRPLDRVAATATRVSELRLDRGAVQLAQRVPAGDTDPRTEVGQVGAALNRMLDHVGNALEARHASEMQVRQFVADASHELRTPLAAIRGYAELSRRSRAPISEEIAHVLGRVESEAKRMTGLVEDLLLLARLDAGRPLAHDPVDLTMLVVDAVSDAHAAGPRHFWQLDLPEEPVTVVGDQQRLHQVLANLLANARTHTPEGTTVTVAVTATADSAVLQVIDFGPGIPAGLQPHIFERFARGDSSRSRAAGSTGLGLSIVSAVVAAHRGTVSVDSRPGQTVFTVTLPLVRVPASEQLARTLPRAR